MKNDLLYCTAIIQSTNKIPYDELVIELKNLERLTNLETGCISFKVIPMSVKEQTFALWEIWKDENGFYDHHNMEYTKELFSKKITKIKVFESSKEVAL